MRAFCLPKKQTFAISIRPRIRHAVGAHGDMVYATGYSKKCTSAAGKKVRMSRILTNKKRTRRTTACPKGTKRSPITSRCQTASRIKSYDKKYMKMSPTQLIRLINSHKSKSQKLASKKRSSSTKRKTGTKKRRTGTKRISVPF